ncbi:MAG: hypothetical protein M5R40_23190 [Anaerolineae bacterium]|nr:hypothetical protein [Anaerolineae bacterium]
MGLGFSSPRTGLGLDRYNLYRVPAGCRTPGDGLGVSGAAACEAQIESVTDAPDAADVYPSWAPGVRILFASSRGGVTGFDIYSVLPGETPRRLIASVRTDWFPRWSPDGARVAFVSGGPDADDFQIYVADADGSNVRQVTTDAAALKGFPVWSPDGTRLAYVAAVDGARDVFVIDVAGGAPARLTDDGKVIAVGDWARPP